MAVESTCGPDAACTHGQLTGYEHRAQGGPPDMRRPEPAAAPAEDLRVELNTYQRVGG